MPSLKPADRQAPARRFLFLQSIATPFFRRLGRELVRRGYHVRRVNICFGDELFWNTSNSTAYRGSFEGWGAFIARYLADEGISDVVLFGDCRPYHKIAAEAARARGIRLHVFEEGYLRPNWITCEAGGVNGYSSFPRDPDEIRRLAGLLPPLGKVNDVSGGFGSRVVWDLLFVVANLVGWPLYPRYRRHRPFHPLAEGAGWLGKLVMRPRESRRTERTIAEIESNPRPYFLLPLQIDSDYQIRVHSPFGNLSAVIEKVVASFAAAAPAGSLLVAKLHPLDNGLVNRRRQMSRLARRYGIEDRVRLIDGGDLNALIAGAEGTIVVNSTVGTSALRQGSPLIALGTAIYDLPGLTHQGGLDGFWTAAVKPDPELFRAFERLLIHWSQVNGSFFSADGIKLGIGASLHRLQAGLPETSRSSGTAEIANRLLSEALVQARA